MAETRGESRGDVRGVSRQRLEIRWWLGLQQVPIPQMATSCHISGTPFLLRCCLRGVGDIRGSYKEARCDAMRCDFPANAGFAARFRQPSRGTAYMRSPFFHFPSTTVQLKPSCFTRYRYTSIYFLMLTYLQYVLPVLEPWITKELSYIRVRVFWICEDPPSHCSF